jgi:hypothetical protein
MLAARGGIPSHNRGDRKRIGHGDGPLIEMVFNFAANRLLNRFFCFCHTSYFAHTEVEELLLLKFLEKQRETIFYCLFIKL